VDTGDYPPTDQHYKVYQELRTELLGLVTSFHNIVNGKLDELNQRLAGQGVKTIQKGEPTP